MWAALTRVLQGNNQIGDDGAWGLGEGLKVNSSLLELFLVRHLFFVLDLFVSGALQVEGGEGVGCTHACAAEQEPNRGRRCQRVGRGAESQQQPAVARSCKAFCFLLLILICCGGDGGRGRGGCATSAS